MEATPRAVSFLTEPRRRSGTVGESGTGSQSTLSRASSMRRLVPQDDRASYSLQSGSWAEQLAARSVSQIVLQQIIFEQKRGQAGINAVQLLITLGEGSVNVTTLYNTYLAIYEEEGATPRGVYGLDSDEFAVAVQKIKGWLSAPKGPPPLDDLTRIVTDRMQQYLPTWAAENPPTLRPKSNSWGLFSKKSSDKKPVPPMKLQDLLSDRQTFPNRDMKPVGGELSLSIANLSALYCGRRLALPKDIAGYMQAKVGQITAAVPWQMQLISTMMERLYHAKQLTTRLAVKDRDSGELMQNLDRWIEELPNPKSWAKLAREKGPLPDSIIGLKLKASLLHLEQSWNPTNIEKEAAAQVLLALVRQKTLQPALICSQSAEWRLNPVLHAEKLTQYTPELLMRGIACPLPNFQSAIVNGETLDPNRVEKPAEALGELITRRLFPKWTQPFQPEEIEWIFQNPTMCSPDQLFLRNIFGCLTVGMHATHQDRFRESCVAIHEKPFITQKDQDSDLPTTIFSITGTASDPTVEVSLNREFVIYRDDDRAQLAVYRRITSVTLNSQGSPIKAGIRIASFDWKSEASAKERESIVRALVGLTKEVDLSHHN